VTFRAVWLAGVALLAVLTLLLFVFPGIDLAVARWCYDAGATGEARFLGNDGFPIGWVYHGVQRGSQLYGVALLVLLLLSLLPWLRWLQRRRRVIGFLFLALVIGPGLVVHTFKSEWPRPRPRDTVPFQGEQEFRRLGELAGACERNCSFPSGHAGFGAYLMAPGFVDRRRRYAWMTAGLLGALGVGAARIAVGGHWLSDVVFSYWIVGASLALTWWLYSGSALRWARGAIGGKHDPAEP
jgi:lipid A 4'-phosphatase